MAQLMIECPECGERRGEKAKVCKCGVNLTQRRYQGKGVVYWVEWYDQDRKRRRERIGSNKAAAEQRLREVLSALAEGRQIKKCPDANTTFGALASWYLELPKTRAKDQERYNRDLQGRLKRLIPFFGGKLLKDITPALVETYKQKRLSEPSGRTPQHLTHVATVNRELASLKTIFNRARENGRAECYPFNKGTMLRENNVRERVLSPEEYTRLLAYCPAHLKPIVKLAYHTAMRRGEILNLTWGQVDLKEGFIRLRPEDTKTNERRDVPLSRELVEMLKDMRAALGGIPLPGLRVFTYAGRSIGSIKRAFITAVKKAGLEDFTFHDLRHTTINNWRLQGHDYFRIMKATGHKTMSVFQRYNSVSGAELKALVGEKI
jgi:integrase